MTPSTTERRRKAPSKPEVLAGEGAPSAAPRIPLSDEPPQEVVEQQRAAAEADAEDGFPSDVPPGPAPATILEAEQDRQARVAQRPGPAEPEAAADPGWPKDSQGALDANEFRGLLRHHRKCPERPDRVEQNPPAWDPQRHMWVVTVRCQDCGAHARHDELID